MSWTLKGEMIETCSCNMLCPCWFGVQELMKMDQGWCATAILFRIESGNFDGLDLSGCTAIVAIDFPGPTMFDAQGIGRVYVEDGATDEQRQALETILQGARGGPMAVPNSLTSSWLPSQSTTISVEAENGNISASVGSFGTIASKRLVNEGGQAMTMQNTGFIMAFQFENQTGDFAPSDGTQWSDPDMPRIFEGKSGVVGKINWSGE